MNSCPPLPLRLLFLCVLWSATPAWVLGQTPLSVQGNYPGTYGFDIAAQVNQAGSDSASADFQANYLPVFNQFINETLTEGAALSDISALRLEPVLLRLEEAYDVRVYFLAEGAGYHNTLGLTTISPDYQTQTASLIFPNATTFNNNYLTGQTTQSLSKRTTRSPLLPGDFVDVGAIDAGTQLDFFLIANGANGGTTIFSPRQQGNPDLQQHVVSYAIPGSPYLFLGFEDLYGLGDRDYNDIVFAVDIGVANVEALLRTPEPGTVSVAIFLGGLLLLCERQNRHRSNRSPVSAI